MSKRLLFLLLLCVSCVATMQARPRGSEARESPRTPYRVLVVIGDQWTDPLSYNIDARRVRGEDFIDVVTMLKVWGVPFDILRLDEQRLQVNRFLDGAAKPRYGCVVWMADPGKLSGQSANYQTLKRVLEEYGTSLIALFDYISSPALAELVGVNYQGVAEVRCGEPGKGLTIQGMHYITRDAAGTVLPDERLSARPSIVGDNGITPQTAGAGKSESTISIVRCTAGPDARVLGTIDGTPQMTVRDNSRSTKTIWIGGGKDWFRRYPVMRELFRRSLVCAIGYGLFNDTFKNGFIFIMDDVGCSEHAWSLKWHYPTPSKGVLEKYLIEPLAKRGLMMVQFLTPGFANPETRMIEVPWTVKPFRDIFGNWQDYGSTKAGLDEGLRRGVFEIQAHRAWSHMNWDLDSPPGPWWGSPVDGELAKTDWYNEIVDVRRGGTPVPSNDLLFIYRNGIDAIYKSFGVTALAAEVRTGAELRPDTHGGDDNGRVAAIAGLGISRECYVGVDRTIEFSMMMPEQFTCHDLDLTERTGAPADTTEAGWDALEKLTTKELMSSKIAGGRRLDLRNGTAWIDAHKDKHWMGFNEACAYLHTETLGVGGREGLGVTLSYDEHYCAHFGRHASHWTLELSEEFRGELGKSPQLTVDGRKGKSALALRQVLEIPRGLGKHRIEVLTTPKVTH